MKSTGSDTTIVTIFLEPQAANTADFIRGKHVYRSSLGASANTPRIASIGPIGRIIFADYRRASSQPCATINPRARETPPPCLLGATDRRADSRSRARKNLRR